MKAHKSVQMFLMTVLGADEMGFKTTETNTSHFSHSNIEMKPVI